MAIRITVLLTTLLLLASAIPVDAQQLSYSPSSGSASQTGATPTFTRTAPQMVFTETLSANVTSITISGALAGDAYTFKWTQAASGGPYTTTAPSNFTNWSQPFQVASIVEIQTCFTPDGTNFTCGPASSTAAYGQAVTTTAPGTPPSGYGFPWFDSTDLDYEIKNSAGTILQMVPRSGTTTTQALFQTSTAGYPAYRAPACGDLSNAGTGCTGVGVTGAAGEILAGSAPALTATPALGTDNSVAGTLTLANGSANAHTIWSSGATTTNTIAGPATVPTTGHILDCTTSGTTCTLTDSGVVAPNVVTASSPGVGVAHFPGGSQAVTSSAIVAADITSGTITGTQIASSVALAGSPTTTTQTACDNSTKAATTAYMAVACNAVETSGSPLAASAQSQTLWNNTSGAYVVDLPATASGLQLCVGNYKTVAHAVSFVPPSGSTIYYKGVSGTTSSSTGLVSGGAAGDFICVEAVDSTTWMAIGAGQGTWTNN